MIFVVTIEFYMKNKVYAQNLTLVNFLLVNFFTKMNMFRFQVDPLDKITTHLKKSRRSLHESDILELRNQNLKLGPSIEIRLYAQIRGTMHKLCGEECSSDETMLNFNFHFN